jgi:hypothetical protein
VFVIDVSFAGIPPFCSAEIPEIPLLQQKAKRELYKLALSSPL